MKLGNIKSRSTKVTLDLDGDTLALSVRPYLMTPAREREMSGTTGPEALDSIVRFFVDYVEWWDLEDDDGMTVPLTVDCVMEALPSTLLLWIIREAKAASDPLGQTS